MKPIWFYLLAAGTSLVAASNVLAAGSNFTTIDFPGAKATQAWGISPRGVIVGFYVAPDSSNHGFLLSGNQYNGVDYPGAALTLVNGIGSQDDIAGEYALTSTGPHHGFLLSKGKFTTIDYPGATTTSAIGTDGAGDIVGVYSPTDNSTHGFLFSSGKFAAIDYPGASSTVVNGMNDLGDVVGGYTMAGVSHGFLLRQGQFATIDFAGAVFTTVTGTNPRGDLVGRYRDSANVNHGYVLTGGQFTTIDFPNATFTGATAISPAGDITGRATVSGSTHGFLLKSSEGRYTLTDLGPVGPTGQPVFISDNGAVGGGAVMGDGSEHGVIWRNGQMKDVGTMGIGISNSYVFGVNNAGQATGESQVFTTDPGGEDFCGFKSVGLPSWGQECLAFFYQNGVMRALPTLGGYNATGSGINESGDVAGWAENTATDPKCPAPQRYQFKPVVWEKGRIQELPTVQSDPDGVAILINNAGQVAGGSGKCAPYNPQVLTPLQSLHAVLWQNGQATDLGNLGGSGLGAGVLALGLNQAGQAVGFSDLPGDQTSHAFLWTKDGGMKDLGVLPGDAQSAGIAINDSGEVVGVSSDASFNLRAYHWQNGDMEDLNSLLVGDSPLILMLACSINSSGQIIGLAYDTDTGDLHGYLLTAANGGAGAHNSGKPLPEDAKRMVRRSIASGAPWGRFLPVR